MTPSLPSSTLDLHTRAEEAAAAIRASGIAPPRIAVVAGDGRHGKVVDLGIRHGYPVAQPVGQRPET